MKAKSKRHSKEYFSFCLRCGGQAKYEDYYPLERRCEHCGATWHGYGLDDVWYYTNEKIISSSVPSGTLLVMSSEVSV